MKESTDTMSPGTRSVRQTHSAEKVLQSISVGTTPYLEIVDLRKAFVRVRSVEDPEEYVDIYKGSLAALANALLKSEAELNRVDLRSTLFASHSSQ